MHECERLLAFTATHSTTAALVSAVGRLGRSPRIGVVWLDAHPDVHIPRTSLSGRLHGMSLALTVGRKAEGDQRWHRLIAAVAPEPACVQVLAVGVRDFEEEEEVALFQLGARVVNVAEIEKGPAAAARDGLCWLGRCDRLVISFDIDVVDANVMPGSASPSWFGLSPIQVAVFLRELLQDPRVAILEVTEYNAVFDRDRFGLHQILSILKHAWP